MKTTEQIFMELTMLYSRRDTLAHEWARGNANPQLLADVWGKIYALRWALGYNVQWGSTQPQEEKYMQTGLYALREFGDGTGGPAPAVYITEYEAKLKAMSWGEVKEELERAEAAAAATNTEHPEDIMACKRELQLREDEFKMGLYQDQEEEV